MSLRQYLKQRLLNDMIRDALQKNSKKYSLIVGDSVTIKILHHVFKMHELNDENIGVVVNVHNQRERVKISPIYFIDGSHESIVAMTNDYEEDKKAPTYAAPIHVYCVRPVQPRSMTLIKNTQLFKRHLKTFKELFCDFLVLEKRLFTFNRDSSFNTLYLNKEERSDELSNIAQQLLGVLFTLKVEPYIRYSSSSRISEQLAKLLNTRWNDTRKTLTSYEASGNCHVIILDRSDDPITPLIHELTYQAMAVDLLHDKIDTSKPKIIKKKLENENENEDEKEEKLNIDNNNNSGKIRIPDESDDVWTRYRHMFIGEVVKLLPKEVEKWKSESAVAQYKSKNKSKDVNLLNVAKDLPQYKQKVKKFTTNTNMAFDIQQIFKDLKLGDTVDLEQSIATWINSDGGNCSRTKIQESFVENVLQDPKKSKLLKLRVFMIYLIAQGGLSVEVRKSLIENAGFDDNANDTIFNLGNLGVVLQSSKTPSMGHKNKNYWKYLQSEAKKQVTINSLRRYKSFLEWSIISHSNGKLSEDDFPWIIKPKNKSSNNNKISASRRHKNSSNNRNNNNNNNNNNINNDKILIYVLGGCCYSEIRSCYELSNNTNSDVYIGSTSILSPQKYLQLLSHKNIKEKEEV